jgi:DNA polymerase/3'-5' exonuclease PolX
VSRYDRRRSVDELVEVAVEVVGGLQPQLAGMTVEICGSFRRLNGRSMNRRLIGDLDVLVSRGDLDDMRTLAWPSGVTATRKKAHGWLEYVGERVYLDAWLCPAESIGPFAMFLTGPMSFNVRMRELTQAAGLLLSQYGLFEPVPSPTRMHPERVKRGERLDNAPTRLTHWHDAPVLVRLPTLADYEAAFWSEWRGRIGLGSLSQPFPGPHERAGWSSK